MRVKTIVQCLITSLALGASASTTDAEIGARAKGSRIRPSNDPFYNPPAGFESSPPGTILRHRRIRDAPTVYGDPAFGSAYQLLYRTTNSIGNPQAAITTVFVPAKHVNNTKYLSYQIPYDAAFVNCGPSYTLRTSSRKSFLGNEDLLLIKSALAQGWYVSTADYEGPRAAYTAGPQAGYATLDGVRAVLASHAITGISRHKSRVTYSLWGYSGGALASEWALELQPSYAPELDFVGAALGGLTPNITSVFHTINKSLFAGLAAAAIVGLSKAYPNLTTYVHENLKPKKKKKFLEAGKQCYYKDIKEFVDEDITSYFKNGDKFLTDRIPKSVVRAAGIMGLHGVPKPPLFVYKAVKDEISVIADTDALVKKFCKDGVDITYERNVAGEHVTEGGLAAPAALRFLVARMDGVPSQGGCHTRMVNTTRKLSPHDERILTKPVYNALQKVIKKEFEFGL